MHFLIRIGPYATNRFKKKLKEFFLGLCLAKPHFCSKLNQNKDLSWKKKSKLKKKYRCFFNKNRSNTKKNEEHEEHLNSNPTINIKPY